MRIDTKNYISYKKIHVICLCQNDNAYKKLNILGKIKNGLREKYKKRNLIKEIYFWQCTSKKHTCISMFSCSSIKKDIQHIP